MNEPNVISNMLQAKTIAVVGLSSDPAKPSNYVSAYMQQTGHRIFPVNPGLKGADVLGEKSYTTLRDLPVKPDVVNVFRPPDAIPAIVAEMIDLGLKSLWVQQGIVNLDAAKQAEDAGIAVVMDHCIMVEHRNHAHGQ